MIAGNRDQFTGLHLTPAVKEELREESQRTGKSMSLLLSEYAEVGLKKTQAKRKKK